MKLADVIAQAKAGVVAAVSCDEQFDAEHGAMNQTSTFGPGLVDLDYFRSLRDPRPHAEPVAGALTTSVEEKRSLGPIAEHMGAKP